MVNTLTSFETVPHSSLNCQQINLQLEVDCIATKMRKMKVAESKCTIFYDSAGSNVAFLILLGILLYIAIKTMNIKQLFNSI